MLFFDGEQGKNPAYGRKAQKRKSFYKQGASQERRAANDVKGSIGILNGCLFFFSF
jgi:hypothetical protein